MPASPAARRVGGGGAEAARSSQSAAAVSAPPQSALSQMSAYLIFLLTLAVKLALCAEAAYTHAGALQRLEAKASGRAQPWWRAALFGGSSPWQLSVAVDWLFASGGPYAHFYRERRSAETLRALGVAVSLGAIAASAGWLLARWLSSGCAADRKRRLAPMRLVLEAVLIADAVLFVFQDGAMLADFGWLFVPTNDSVGVKLVAVCVSVALVAAYHAPRVAICWSLFHTLLQQDPTRRPPAVVAQQQ